METTEKRGLVKGVFGDESKGVDPSELPDLDTPLLKAWYQAFPSWRDALEDPSLANVYPPVKLYDQVRKFLKASDKKELADYIGDTDDDWSFDYIMKKFTVSFNSFPETDDEDMYYAITIYLLPNGQLDPNKITVEEVYG